MDISGIGHAYAHMRTRPPRLNPLARGCHIWPDANFSPMTLLRAAAPTLNPYCFLASYALGKATA